MKKTPRNFLRTIAQVDLFANRETVGTENEVAMIARFEGPAPEASPAPANAAVECHRGRFIPLLRGQRRPGVLGKPGATARFESGGRSRFRRGRISGETTP